MNGVLTYNLFENDERVTFKYKITNSHPNFS